MVEKQTQTQMQRMHKGYREVDRPSWDEYFLGLCFYVAERSEDYETHHGAILVDSHNHIVGTGYNSLPMGGSKGLLPNTREEDLKYEWMIHAEENAIFNSTVNLWQISGVTCYITGRPCLRCIQRLHNSNVHKIVYADTPYHFKDYDKELEKFNSFVEDRCIEVVVLKAKLDWLTRPVSKLEEYGLIQEQKK